MPSIKCHCGNRILLGEIPSNNKFHVIPDEKVESLVNLIQVKDEEQSFDYFYSISRELAICSNCERIWIDHKHNGVFESYKKE